ncbi:hypothetical protein JTE90_002245 [Oedothorax gibbosus]|uniref:Uncharacterized protein n=1 Tax=Oedothorax gibbosus TaxID=931172 RepID=A0AAV6V5Y1_9ARAC|nr:hypothetical protein JTE90_002245 [Oedothorax gibbosus]
MNINSRSYYWNAEALYDCYQLAGFTHQMTTSINRTNRLSTSITFTTDERVICNVPLAGSIVPKSSPMAIRAKFRGKSAILLRAAAIFQPNNIPIGECERR